MSVVIPARDDAAPLAVCLRALQRQEVTPTEVVVVDNGSSDGTAAVALAFGARVVPEPVAGIPQAAAAGYDAAQGDVVARLDADSVPPPDWLARVVAAMAEPDVTAVTGTGTFYGLPRSLRRASSALYLGAYYVLGHAALGHPALWGSNMAFRREAWLAVRDQVHRHDREIHDDMDLAFALGPHRRIRLDRTLHVAVSARSVQGAAQVRRRFRRQFRTLALNWRTAPPWERWAARFGVGGSQGGAGAPPRPRRGFE